MTLRRVRFNSRRGRRAFQQLLERGASGVEAKIVRQSKKIVDGVRRRGDGALLQAVERFDGVKASSVGRLRLSGGPQEPLPAGFEDALEHAIESVERYHRAFALPGSDGLHVQSVVEADGVVLEECQVPLRRVGIYTPGGRFPYPSTVVMTVVPARLAGVEEIVVATPPGAWSSSPALRHTLRRLGVEEIWGMGGAHAVAALAYGTDTIERVDLIAGPGNAWVAAAKQLVAGDVGVDREAGPSEVVIVADGEAPSELVAADLIAQAEHDPLAVSVLLTPDSKLARNVAEQVKTQLQTLSTAEVASRSLGHLSMAFVVDDLEQALGLAEELAPEHLQLMGGAEDLSERVRQAGAVFVGAATPTVLGDYVAGPSHVLPTGGSARFASGLGTADFYRRFHRVRFSETAAHEWAQHAATLADVEGLAGHARSARLRTADAVIFADDGDAEPDRDAEPDGEPS